MITIKMNRIIIRAKIFILVRLTHVLLQIRRIFYTNTLFVGAILHINSRRFIITSADLNDYRYMQENPDQFSEEAIESVRDYLISTNCLSPNEAVISSC